MPTLNNAAFCILPFVHLHVDENSKVKPCCYSTQIGGYNSKFDFNNDPALTDIRQKMMAGERVPECQNCYRIEDAGGESFRIRDTQEWFKILGISTPEQAEVNLIYYDIRNDNTCNLACRICYPGASTQLVKEYNKLGWPVLSHERSTRLSETVNYQTIKQLQIAGGEPTLMPEFKTFLQRAIEQGRTDISLRVITNGTNINKEILTLLEQFPNMTVTISVDGFKDVNRYIRWPCDWDYMVGNMTRFYQMTQNMSFNITVSIWNITRLYELVSFLETNYPYAAILLNEAMPIKMCDFSPFIHPNKLMAQADLKKLAQTKSYHSDEFFRNKVEYFATKLENSTLDLIKLKNFFEYNDRLDQSRNVKLKDYIPELDECRDYLTKPI